jgi:alpha-D-glucose phosphate-specific phosphoglucomutase
VTAPTGPTPARIEFGTDGWRAIIAEDFTFDNVRLCAQAVADYLRGVGLAERGLVVGYDTRFASDRFAEAVAEVAAGNDVPVFLCEAPAPTPVVSYSVLDRQAGGAVVITASHNSGEWNGFKYKPDYAGSASPEVVAELEDRIRVLQRAEHGSVRRLALTEAERQHLVTRFDPAPPYFAQAERLVDVRRLRGAGFTVVADAMHGAGIGYFRRILEGGSTKVIEIRNERNPLFPGMHNPEPIGRNLDALADRVLAEKADVGLATDGDADRIGLMDERGEFINPLDTYGLLLLYLLDVRGQSGPAIRSLTSTAMADRLGKLYGIPVIETPVGFKYIGPKMMEIGAIMGGEESGGFGFGGHIPERDAIIAGLFALDFMAARGRPLSEVLNYVSERAGASFYERVDLTFDPAVRGEILRRVASAEPTTIDGARVVSMSEVDGKKFVLDDGTWLLIRFSGTEPLLRIYTETTSQERVPRIIAEGRRIAGV